MLQLAVLQSEVSFRHLKAIELTLSSSKSGRTNFCMTDLTLSSGDSGTTYFFARLRLCRAALSGE